jgi:hypothetical protein
MIKTVIGRQFNLFKAFKLKTNHVLNVNHQYTQIQKVIIFSAVQ